MGDSLKYFGRKGFTLPGFGEFLVIMRYPAKGVNRLAGFCRSGQSSCDTVGMIGINVYIGSVWPD